MNLINTFASLATLILFLIYFIGRTITIIAVKKIWKDKVVLPSDGANHYGIVDDIYPGHVYDDSPIYGFFVSKEGIRNLKVFTVEPDDNGLPIKKGKELYRRSFLNIDEAVAFHVPFGDLFPTFFIEYNTVDYMKVSIEWRDNLKNGVFSELVQPKHTIKSVLYYLFK